MADRKRDFRVMDTKDPEFSQALEEELTEITQNLTPQNLHQRTLDLVFTAANEIQQVSHELGRIPEGYSIISRNVDGTLIDPRGNDSVGRLDDLVWDEDVMWLQATAAGGFTVRIW